MRNLATFALASRIDLKSYRNLKIFIERPLYNPHNPQTLTAVFNKCPKLPVPVTANPAGREGDWLAATLVHC